MTYIFTCDGFCEETHEGRPALMGEFSEPWFKSTEAGGEVAELYDPGDIVTLCGPCTVRLLLRS